MLEPRRAGGNPAFLAQAEIVAPNIPRQRGLNGGFAPSQRQGFCRVAKE
jgi:hypothetical protein